MADNSTTPPIIALDTNALVQSIPTWGRFRPIIEGFDAGRFLLVISNEILLEYEEILKVIGGPMAWSAFESLLIARAAFVRRVDPTYSWESIMHDPDDDKFVDAAVAGDADWIVTEDSHYNVLFQETRQPLPCLPRPICPGIARMSGRNRIVFPSTTEARRSRVQAGGRLRMVRIGLPFVACHGPSSPR